MGLLRAAVEGTASSPGGGSWLQGAVSQKPTRSRPLSSDRKRGYSAGSAGNAAGDDADSDCSDGRTRYKRRADSKARQLEVMFDTMWKKHAETAAAVSEAQLEQSDAFLEKLIKAMGELKREAMEKLGSILGSLAQQAQQTEDRRDREWRADQKEEAERQDRRDQDWQAHNREQAERQDRRDQERQAHNREQAERQDRSVNDQQQQQQQMWLDEIRLRVDLQNAINQGGANPQP